MYGTRVVSNQSLKLEVIGDDVNLQPDPFGLVEAAIELVKLGFQVLPYCTEDWVFCRRLMDPGCEVLMPWAAHIGTGQGPRNARALRELRERAPQIPLIVDAGIGLPSHACQVMEWGFDGVLLNTAVSRALDPVRMASAFAKAINAGRSAFLAGPMIVQEIAAPSTPEIGRPFTLDASQSANSVRQESRVKVILRRRDGVSRTVVVKSGLLRYSQKIFVGSHVLHADEPGDSGGKYFGPNPCELLLAALGACTSITVRMYAERKQGPLKSVEVRLAHSKIHAEECATCDTEEGTLDRIEREIALFGDLSDEQQHRTLEIAERCPVHRTLVSEVQICTRLIDDHPPVPIADK